MSNPIEVNSLGDMELAKEKALQVYTSMATKAKGLEMAAYLAKLPVELEQDLAMWLWELHSAHRHHDHPPAAPPASPSYKTMTNSVKLPAVPSTAGNSTILRRCINQVPQIRRSSSPALCSRNSSQDPRGGSHQDLR